MMMKIKGIQKTTLIDYPGKIACTLFLFGCNFRCGFCHNPELVFNDKGSNIEEKKLFAFLEKKKKYLDGVCITGGEPMLTLEEDFLRSIKNLGYFVKVDTNGSFPERLREFLEKGLIDFVAMDIKASREKYSEIAGVGVELHQIEKSIKLIAKTKEYEFRTTIIRGFHNEEEMKKIAHWISNLIGGKAKKFVLQAFKNKGKFLNKAFEKEKDVQEEELLPLKEAVEDSFEEVEIRG